MSRFRTSGAGELRANARRARLKALGVAPDRDGDPGEALLDYRPPCDKCRDPLICKSCDKLQCVDCGYVLQCQRCLVSAEAPTGHSVDRSSQYSLRDTGSVKVGKDELDLAQMVSELQTKLDGFVEIIANSNVNLRSVTRDKERLSSVVEGLLADRLASLAAVDSSLKSSNNLRQLLTQTTLHHLESVEGLVSTSRPGLTFRAWRRVAREARLQGRIDTLRNTVSQQEEILEVTNTNLRKNETRSEKLSEEMFRLRKKLRTAARTRIEFLVSDTVILRTAFSAWRGFRREIVLATQQTAPVEYPPFQTHAFHLALSSSQAECQFLRNEVARLKQDKLAMHLSYLAGDQSKVLQAEILRLRNACI